MAGGYPIILEIRARQIVVIGGGAVAVRKVKGLLAAGATRVRVVSPAFHEEMPDGIERIDAVYGREALSGATLVFAATDRPEVNEAIVEDARSIGALAARADDQEDGSADFTTPAMHRAGPVLMTVSSGGNPALSAKIRDALAAAIDPKLVQLAEAMQQLRPLIRDRLPAPRRREALRALCSDAAIAKLAGNDVQSLRSWLSETFPELND